MAASAAKAALGAGPPGRVNGLQIDNPVARLTTLQTSITTAEQMPPFQRVQLLLYLSPENYAKDMWCRISALRAYPISGELSLGIQPVGGYRIGSKKLAKRVNQPCFVVQNTGIFCIWHRF